MRLTVNELASLVKGTVVGDGSRIIENAAGLENASASDISFLRDANKAETVSKFNQSAAGAVFVPAGFQQNGKTVIQVAHPLAAFAKVLEVLGEEKRNKDTGIHPLASISPKAKVGKNCLIGAFTIIEAGAEIGDNVRLMGQNYIGHNSKVGNDTLFYPQVVLRENVTVGARCILHNGALIGSDGFGFFYAQGKHNKIPQIGTVIIEDDVEIGAGTTVDRGTIGATIIKNGTKLDNLVQVAHNVTLGENSIMAAQSGVAGSTIIGRGVMMGGQSGISDHLTIGDGTQVAAKSGVMQSADAGSILFGVPAQPIKEALKQIGVLKRMAKIYKDLKK